MSDMWTVWLCCGNFDTYDSRDEAFQRAHAANNSDGHTPQAIEGPNGEDLTKEFEAYDREQSQRSYEARKARCDDAKSRVAGTVEVRSPGGDWYGERVYSEDERDKQLAEMREAFGPDRVRFVAAVDEPRERERVNDEHDTSRRHQ